MLHHVPSITLQDQLLAEARRVLRPGGVLAGTDTAPSVLLRLAHIGDTMIPVDVATLGQRLEAAGFDEVEVKKGLGGAASGRSGRRECQVPESVPSSGKPLRGGGER